MHDTRDAVRLTHHLDARSALRLERGIVVLVLAGLVAAAFAFPYI